MAFQDSLDSGQQGQYLSASLLAVADISPVPGEVRGSAAKSRGDPPLCTYNIQYSFLFSSFLLQLYGYLFK